MNSITRRRVIFGGLAAAALPLTVSLEARPLNQAVALLGAPVATAPGLYPSRAWTGVAGSAPGAPSDPARTVAKPACRWLSVPADVITGDTIIAVDAFARDGVNRVTFWCEGKSVDVTAETWVNYTDANGTARQLRGHAVTLTKAQFDRINTAGTANIWATAWPSDPTMQPRTIGPFTVHNRAQDYAATRTIGTGGDHATIAAGLNWIATNSAQNRNVRLQLITNGDYDLSVGAAATYNNMTHWCTIEAAPGVTARMTGGALRNPARLKYDGLRFRGAGIIMDVGRFTSVVMENTGLGRLWLDGVTLEQTGGNTAVYDGIYPQTYWMTMSAGTARSFWATECSGANLYNGLSYCDLVRNCTLSNISADACQNNKCVHGINVDGVSPSGSGGLRTHMAALDVTYTGAGTPVFAISRGPNCPVGPYVTSNWNTVRIFQAYVNGVAVGAPFTITNPSAVAAGSGYTTWADLAAHINTIPNFAATVNGAAGTRRASSASIAGRTPSGAAADAAFTASISGTTLTVQNTPGILGTIAAGQPLFGIGVPAGTTIISGSGLVWTISTPLTLSAQAFGSGITAALPFAANVLTITSIFDVHGDGAQYFGTFESYIGRFMRFTNIDSLNGTQGKFVDQTSTSLTDCWWRNYIVATAGNGITAVSQWLSTFSHSGLVDSSWWDQPFNLRSDAAGVAKFNPDNRCAIRNCSFHSLAWLGTPDVDINMTRINVRSGSLPSGTTSSTNFTTNLYANAPASLAPLAGGNLLLSGTYVGALLPDGSWNV